MTCSKTPTLTTLVTGANAAERERAIATALDPGLNTALILEGLPSSAMLLANTPRLHVSRIAPGCLCCTGNLVMRVTLNRILRQTPQRLYIGLATSEHLERIRHFLSQSPYGNLLQLTKDLRT